jgi:hypothetical protein
MVTIGAATSLMSVIAPQIGDKVDGLEAGRRTLVNASREIDH